MLVLKTTSVLHLIKYSNLSSPVPSVTAALFTVFSKPSPTVVIITSHASISTPTSKLKTELMNNIETTTNGHVWLFLESLRVDFSVVTELFWNTALTSGRLSQFQFQNHKSNTNEQVLILNLKLNF
mgnify:CR=1 FL=1